MKNKPPSESESQHMPGKIRENLSSLLCSIIRYANRGVTRKDFLKEITHLLINYLKCDGIILQLNDYGKTYSYEAIQQKRLPHRLLEKYHICDDIINIDFKSGDFLDLKTLSSLIISDQYKCTGYFFSEHGSFFTKEMRGLYEIDIEKNGESVRRVYRMESGYQSLALIPLKVNDEFLGLLQLKAQVAGYFTEENIELCEIISETIGIASLDRSMQLSLRERVKELDCLYGIAKIIEKPGLSLEKILRKIVNLLPPAWMYPNITAARITVDGGTYTSRGFRETSQKLSSKIIVDGLICGVVDVVYLEEMPELHEGPFLLEERNLINAISQQIALIIKRKIDEEEHEKLQNQLRHADRLATIGQLAAGVAHELNEPLTSILGFAEILKDESSLNKQALKDVNKIENASLYAREVVKKLLLFSRQIPQNKTLVNINQVVESTLFLFESRCVKEGINIVKKLDPNVSKISLDSSQLQQVIINLVVNAIQAMSTGDTLTLSTYQKKESIVLTVEDTGIGMSEEVKKQLFVPFFTTKDVDQGTGLGLPVVHGIVTSHGGTISVESEVGKGSRFVIILPITSNAKQTEQN